MRKKPQHIDSVIEQIYGRLKTISAACGERTARAVALWILRNLPDVSGTSGKTIKEKLKMRKTYGIEIKADFEDPAREKMMKKLIRQATRQVLAKANLLVDNGRPAQAACRTADWFEGGTLEELGGIEDDEAEA